MSEIKNMRKGFFITGLACFIMMFVISILFIPACCVAMCNVSSRKAERKTVTETISNGQTNITTVIEYTYE